MKRVGLFALLLVSYLFGETLFKGISLYEKFDKIQIAVFWIFVFFSSILFIGLWSLAIKTKLGAFELEKKPEEDERRE